MRSWNETVEVRERVQSNNTGTLDIAGRERVKEESRELLKTCESSHKLRIQFQFDHFT